MTSLALTDLLPAMPEIFLALIGMVLLVLGVVRGNEGTNAICWAAVWAFVIAGILMLGLDWGRHVTLGGMFVMDGFAGYMKLLVLGGLALSLILSIRYLEQEGLQRFEYPILVIFAGLGMFIMLSAHNMLSVYMGLELQSLALYVLATFHRDHVKSAEAGIKYFVLGALASGMLLFGISLIYGYTGTFDFTVMAQSLSSLEETNMAVVVGLVFILVGLAFKISAVPFHMWTPDVYEGAPMSVTALFAIVPKVALLGLMMRVLYEPFGAVAGQWQQVIWFLSAASMSVAAFAAIAQNNIKRLMAYSSIGHMGYALIGVIVGTSAGTTAVLVYMALYMVMSAGAFGIIMSMRRNGMAVEQISDLAGLSRNNPLLAYGFAFLLLSMAGIPPLAGFFGKLMIFQSAIAGGYYILAVLGVLTSVVSAYYYIRLIKVMFFDEAADEFDNLQDRARRIVVLASVLFVCLFIFNPAPLVEVSRTAAAALFAAS
jgi:NADH-quinone oxidoreductase subunit N